MPDGYYGAGGGGPSSGGSGTTIIIALVIVVVLLSSSALGVFAYYNHWFGIGGSSSDTSMSSMDMSGTGTGTGTDSPQPLSIDSSSSAGGFTGLSTACALSYKPNQDVYNAAVPPFDPNACQGVQMEANCQAWLSTQQGTQWKWQKTGNLDGCVPVAPDVTLSPGIAGSRPNLYNTDAGTVALPAGATIINQSGGSANAQAGGYGKGGRWRNVADSKKIITQARRGALPKVAGGRTVNTTGAARRARANPVPFAQPAYSDHAPYTPGMVNYSMI